MFSGLAQPREAPEANVIKLAWPLAGLSPSTSLRYAQGERVKEKESKSLAHAEPFAPAHPERRGKAPESKDAQDKLRRTAPQSKRGTP